MQKTNSLPSVLASISESKSLEIFRSISTGPVEAASLEQRMSIPKKQFYLRCRRLTMAGLIKKNKDRFSLTAFGEVVYHSELVLEGAVTNYWKLKAIDSFQVSQETGEQNRIKLIKSIIHDTKIENILMKYE